MMISTCIASDKERHRRMSADGMIPEPLASFTHAITIAAPTVKVWPWLVQMGAGRAGWYSWDFIDNGGVKSSRSIFPEYQNIKIGDIFPAIPGAGDAFVLHALDPGRNLVLSVPSSSDGFLVSWEFMLESVRGKETRLIVRARVADMWLMDTPRQFDSVDGTIFVQLLYGILAIIPQWLMLPLAGIGHRIMEARMLRGIKFRSESTDS